MNPPPPSQSPMPLNEELQLRIQALLKLRREMLVLHARLEYLRLMLRISSPVVRSAPPRSGAR